MAGLADVPSARATDEVSSMVGFSPPIMPPTSAQLDLIDGGAVDGFRDRVKRG